MLPFRLGHGLPDFGATVGALIDEVDLRHAPMRLDLSDIHRKQSNAAGADNRGRLDLVMLDVGWHIGSPSAEARRISTPNLKPAYAAQDKSPSSTFSNGLRTATLSWCV
jgi:hypothetical protein